MTKKTLKKLIEIFEKNPKLQYINYDGQIYSLKRLEKELEW